MVTGHAEALSVYNDPAVFSSCNSVTGPFPGFPVPLEGDDVSPLIEQYRDQLPMSDQVITFDPPKHTDHRGLLMRLITPKRLSENEDSMWRYADRQIDEFIGNGECEFVREYASPFAMVVIADLLGVPEEDYDLFRKNLTRTTGLGSTGDDKLAHNPLEFLYQQFSLYVEDRRREPRSDVLSGLAAAKFRDGSTPEVIDVVRVAANVFAAGQETSVRLLASALQRLAEDPVLAEALRADHAADPGLRRGDAPLREPGQGGFPAGQGRHHDRGSAHPRRHDGHGAQQRGQPGSPQVRPPVRLRPRTPQRAPQPHLRPRCPRVSRSAARPDRGPHQRAAAARADVGHRDLRACPRSRRRPQLLVCAHLHPAGAEPPPARIHAGDR